MGGGFLQESASGERRMIDPITMELIRSSLHYASEEMGIALRNSSYSPNIKERMDHSAAIFNADGRLLAQAEHIPVHLGSLPWGLRNTLDYCAKENLPLEKGSMIVLNNPYIAGTHLNDITVFRPVFHDNKLVAYTGNKAHHSDVGGNVPGSISLNARTIFEEGVIVDPTYLMRNDEFMKGTLSFFRTNTRTPIERIGDLKAQVAANLTGERRVQQLIERYGAANFLESHSELFDYTERIMRSRIQSLKEGTYFSKDFLEHPENPEIVLKAKIVVKESKIGIDYSGTDPQQPFPLNAVFGVTLSGVHYVLRSILGDDVPMNEGAFRVVEVYAPEGSLLNAKFPYPVAEGNLETSQRNVDLLYRGFWGAIPDKVPAAAGGCMNNIMMGGINRGALWAFYETIGTGLGGRKGMDGTDGIHANMTNTMNTPIEEIERALPVLLKQYELRPDSSGAGEYRGGCGLIRTFQMLGQSTTVTVLSDREKHQPWGLLKGKPGQGTEVILHQRQLKKRLPTKCTLNLKREDIIEIRTAGGGGYGSPKKRDPAKIREDLENGILTKNYVNRNYRQA
jgi:N-methylhydantoinase B